MVLVPYRQHLRTCTACYGDNLTCLYVDDVGTSQETCISATINWYGNDFTFLYVDDVRTSQETCMILQALL
jgi:hypothetical protein